MRRFLGFLISAALLFGAGGVSNAVVIENISLDGCISELCISQISVTANDPAGGNLAYAWEILNDDAGLIIGSGADVGFDPPNTGPHPHAYQIKVTVTSDASDLAPSRIIDIYVKPVGDANCDGVVNVLDKVIVRNHFGQSCGDPGWDPTADVNCDCVVNVLDKVYVRNQFGEKEEFVDEHYFYDNFECGTEKWVISGLDWDLIESAFQGGNWSLTDSPEGNYSPNADAVARMKSSIDLSTSTFPVLTFWHKYLVHYNDYIYVDISTDAGFTWSNLWNTGHYKWADTWSPAIIDLSNYKSTSVKIRFRLRASDSYFHDGWYIDDVVIRERDAIPVLSFPFADDFENGLDNWLVSGVEWPSIQSEVRGGHYAVADSPNGNYNLYANSVMMTNGFIDLSGSTSPVLTFWHKYLLHYGDYIYVELSEDYGLNWTTLWSTGHYKWVDTWTPAIIDLSSYNSASAMIRFRLRASDSYVHDGWYIDDIVVQEKCADPAPPYPFCDDFESGLGNWEVSGLDWALTEDDSRSPTHSVIDSPDGNYSTDADAVIMTKGCIDLSTATFPVLSWWNKYSLHYNDYVYVDISTDGGLSWTTLWSRGHNTVVDTWHLEDPIDLRPYISPSVKIRFRLRASDTYVSDGWKIDDVCVKEFE